MNDEEQNTVPDPLQEVIRSISELKARIDYLTAPSNEDLVRRIGTFILNNPAFYDNLAQAIIVQTGKFKEAIAAQAAAMSAASAENVPATAPALEFAPAEMRIELHSLHDQLPNATHEVTVELDESIIQKWLADGADPEAEIEWFITKATVQNIERDDVPSALLRTDDPYEMRILRLIDSNIRAFPTYRPETPIESGLKFYYVVHTL